MSEVVVKEEVPEVVSKDAYAKVSTDMHKFKSEAKALQAKLADIQAEQEAKDKSLLEEKEQWHTLYKKAEEKLKGLETERTTERTKFVESHKINAVIQTLGGFKKNEYNKFIDSSKIDVADDGSVSESSVLLEVERIRKEYPELLKTSNKAALPADAPRQFANKSVKDMSADERAAARLAALKRI
jgi:hypothetical protein